MKQCKIKSKLSRVLSVFLALVMIFVMIPPVGVVAGEFELVDQSSTLSEELRVRVLNDWLANSFGERPVYNGTNARIAVYLGTYNGNVVFVPETTVRCVFPAHNQTILGLDFAYGNRIMVWNNGEVNRLSVGSWGAIERGWITEQDVHRIHVVAKTSPLPRHMLIENIPVDIEERIKADFWIKHSSSMSDGDFVWVARYLGTYDGRLAVVMNGSAFMYATALYSETVNGLTFNYPHVGPFIMIWSDGEFYRLASAFNSELITPEDLKQIHLRWTRRNGFMLCDFCLNPDCSPCDGCDGTMCDCYCVTLCCFDPDCTHGQCDDCGEWSCWWGGCVCPSVPKICERCYEINCERDDCDVTDCEHDFGKWTVYTPKTCVTAGIKRRVCTDCTFYEKQTEKARGHKFPSITTRNSRVQCGNTTRNLTCKYDDCSSVKAVSVPRHLRDCNSNTCRTCSSGNQANNNNNNNQGNNNKTKSPSDGILTPEFINSIREGNSRIEITLPCGTRLVIDPRDIPADVTNININANINIRTNGSRPDGIPLNSIMLEPVSTENFDFNVNFIVTKEQLKSAGVAAENVQLFHIKPDGTVVQGLGSVTFNTDGSVTVTTDSALPHILVAVNAGHVTGGESISIADALAILRYIVGLDSVLDNNAIAYAAATVVDPTGKVSIADALAILRFIVGLPSELD
ncbi:MAG: hypothetical protein FWF76_05125 [Oscillospiraceae bacterium]|nr:hypothetical protein [Oscillospiraceae bacterium]